MPWDGESYASAITDPYMKDDRNSRLCPFSVPGKPHPAGWASDDYSQLWVELSGTAKPGAAAAARRKQRPAPHKATPATPQCTTTVPLHTATLPLLVPEELTRLARRPEAAAPTIAQTAEEERLLRRCRGKKTTPSQASPRGGKKKDTRRRENGEKGEQAAESKSSPRAGGGSAKLRAFVAEAVGLVALDSVMRRLEGLGLSEVADLSYLEASDLSVWYVSASSRELLMQAAARVKGATAVGVDSQSGQLLLLSDPDQSRSGEVAASASGPHADPASAAGGALVVAAVQSSTCSAGLTGSSAPSLHSWSGEFPVTLKGPSPLVVVSQDGGTLTPL